VEPELTVTVFTEGGSRCWAVCFLFWKSWIHLRALMRAV